MPEREQTNLTLLTGMNTQLDATTQALTRAQQDKSLNETLLSNQEATWKNSLVGLQNPEPQDQELAVLQQKLSKFRVGYDPDHPEVSRMKAQSRVLDRKMTEA